MRNDLWSLFNPIWILTIILFIVIAVSYLVSAQNFNAQGVPIKADGSIDWDYINTHGMGGGSSTTGNVAKVVLGPISACYNLTIHVEQDSGNRTIPRFDSCVNVGGTMDFTCDCKGIDNFNLTMYTDDTPVTFDYYGKDITRWYKLTIGITQYRYNSSTADVIVHDWGNTAVANGKPVYLGECSDVVYETRTEYINVTTPGKTIYVNQTQIQYIENTTRINELNNNLTQCQTESTDKDAAVNHYKSKSGWLIFALVIVVVGIGMIYYFNRRRD